jgi:L-asparaginase II
VPVVAEVVRSGFVESVHHGRVAGLAADGSLALAIGDVAVATYGRSSNKPMQAVGMLELGLVLPPDQLALAIASHSGEPMHLARVRAILAAHGLDESALDNTADLPLDHDAAVVVLRAGHDARPVTQNCSGKHAAMLATCVVNGWSTVGYRDPGHPLQQALGATIERLSGETIAHVGVDGCGAPAHAVSLTGLARATATIASAHPGSAEFAVASAMRRHPELVGGTGRDVSLLMQAVPGLIAKDGAEGVYAAAMPDGRAVALKIDDGGGRARAVVLVAALARLGVPLDDAAHVAARTVVLGHGEPVGEVRALAL